jgi:HPt (histidine-containing phosphotransfer) domain-containing protein
MDAFLAKPITPEKLRTVVSDWMKPQTSAPSIQAPASGEGDLSLLAYLADGTRAGLDREVARFLSSLGSAACEVLTALTERSRPGLARAAHKVASHAHLIGSGPLGKAAEELEARAHVSEFSELEREAANLAARIATLRETLPRHRSADKPE